MNFTANQDETRIISEIAKRACKQLNELDHLTTMMDIEVVHSNGCPLRLVELLDAPDVDFAHDIVGIQNHLDRKTGKLLDCFSPRYSAHDPH